MNLKIATALCLLLLCLPIGAQKKNINAAWEFQRLNRTQRQVEIKNQGSDWSSQYNIEHVSQQSKGLTVPSDTLRVGACEPAPDAFHRAACRVASVARRVLLSQATPY